MTVVTRLLASFAVIVGMAVGLLQFGPAPAYADVSPECWAHLADKKTHTTPAADRRFHLKRGEPSPCTEADAREYSKAQESARRDEPRKSDSVTHQNSTHKKKDDGFRIPRRDKFGFGCKWVVFRCG